MKKQKAKVEIHSKLQEVFKPLRHILKDYAGNKRIVIRCYTVRAGAQPRQLGSLKTTKDAYIINLLQDNYRDLVETLAHEVAHIAQKKDEENCREHDMDILGYGRHGPCHFLYMSQILERFAIAYISYGKEIDWSK